MSGTKSVLDSNAIIYASQGVIDAEKLLAEKDSYYSSIISYIEVYSFDLGGSLEKEIIDEIMANLEVIELNNEIANQAIVYRRNKVKKIKLPDAVILATAKCLDADLITDNFRDFQGIDSSVRVISLDDFRITA
jgi:predicted nucleic acid-binding protein